MNVSTIDLNLLLVLHAVLEERSVVSAARRLHVTPPAVSNALARLRELLGDPLFVRKGRGVVATPRALELAPLLRQTFDNLERALNAADFEPATSTREFKICLADGDQIATLPRIAASFVRRMPRAQLTAVSVDALLSSGGLASPLADCLIGPLPDEPDLHSRPLYEEAAALVVRRGHPRISDTLTKQQFASERHIDTHIALGRPGIGHRAAEAVFARHGLRRDVAVTVPTFAAAAMLAAATDLIAAMPLRVALTLAAAAPLRVVAAPMPAVRFHMQLVWHGRTHSDPGACAFRSLVVEALSDERDGSGAVPRARRAASAKPRRGGLKARSL